MASDLENHARTDSWVSELDLTPEMAQTLNEIENMTEIELQDYIGDLLAANQASPDGMASSARAGVLEAAWLAAAQIAISGGYECAGTLVKYSVLGQDFSEGNGTFANKIRPTPAFSNWKSDSPTTDTDIEFNTSDNSDLYYAIHGASIHLSGSSQGGTAHIYDTFDFEYSNLSTLFATLVNTWGALSQSIGVLNPISVHIEISL